MAGLGTLGMDRKVSKGERMMSLLRDSMYTRLKQTTIMDRWKHIARPLDHVDIRREIEKPHRSLPSILHKGEDVFKIKGNNNYKSILRNKFNRMSGSTTKSRASIDGSSHSREALYYRRRESIRETLERMGGVRKARIIIKQKDPDLKLAEEQLNVWDCDELIGNHGDLTARTLARSNVSQDKPIDKKVTFSMKPLSPIAKSISPATSSGLEGHAVTYRPRNTSVPVIKSGDTSSTSTIGSKTGRSRTIRLSLKVPVESEVSCLLVANHILTKSDCTNRKKL